MTSEPESEDLTKEGDDRITVMKETIDSRAGRSKSLNSANGCVVLQLRWISA